MPVSAGKHYPPAVYEVTRAKIKRYAAAVGETNPLHHELAAARAAGYADLLAPPMFAAVYAWPSMTKWIFDPQHGIEFSRFVHTAQEFRWGPPVVAGDVITSVTTLRQIERRGHMRFYVSESVSKNQAGETVAIGTWTNIFREAE